MKITKRQLRRIIKEWTGQGMSLFELGQEDAVREIPPQDPDPEYMRGYNEALLEFGEDPVEPPARHRSPRGRSVHEATAADRVQDKNEAVKKLTEFIVSLIEEYDKNTVKKALKKVYTKTASGQRLY